MGIYRLLLSLFVVMSHFGRFPFLAGQIPVLAFFSISGYLMALVIDRTYGTDAGGTRRFYANRALRIGPPLVLFSVLTIALVYLRGNPNPLLDADRPPSDVLTHPFVTSFEVLPPVLVIIPVWIPQAWSLVCEGCFYLCAPLLARLWGGRRRLFWAILLASAALNVWALTLGPGLDPLGPNLDPEKAGFIRVIYKNFFTNIVIFQLGMLCYYRGEAIVARIPFPRAVVAVTMVGLGVFISHRSPFNLIEFLPGDPAGIRRLATALYASVVPVFVITLILPRIQLWPQRMLRLDRWAGDLAYGVFVNQFVAVFLVLIAGKGVVSQSTPLSFGLITCVVAVALAWAGFVAVERPVNRLRDRLRGGTSQGERLAEREERGLRRWRSAPVSPENRG